MGSKQTLTTRRAYHAGSWYSDSPQRLDATLSSYLDAASKDHDNGNDNDSANQNNAVPRAIISPHAGYAYSGPTAAYAYLALREAMLAYLEQNTKDTSYLTIVVLHPSHHVYIDDCALSSVDMIDTPLGSLVVDQKLREELMKSGGFKMMERHVDEREHSGEMQYPFIAKVMRDIQCESNSVRVLPIMVGALGNKKERLYGKIFAPFLARKDIFCIVSSDFCHWGQRFDYVLWNDKSIEIYEFIKLLDKEGMDHISMQDPGAFAIYLKNYRNTICGRNPISVWLHAISENKENGIETLDVQFVNYAQSSQARSMRDSSVSYASCVARKQFS